MTTPLDKTLQASGLSRIPTVAIFGTAACLAGFAIWLGMNPSALLLAFGVEQSTPQMLTEVQALYAGVEIAIAMIVLWRRESLFAVRLFGGLPLAGPTAGRCIGLMVDGFSVMHLGFASLEIVRAAFCLAGCVIISRERTDG